MSGLMSALRPGGVQAGAIAELAWIFFAVCGVVWVLVMLALAAAIVRHRRAPDAAPAAGGETTAHAVIGGAVGLTVMILFAFLVLSFVTGRAMSSLDLEDAVTVQVIGHQFWWELRYEDPEPTRVVATANELHVPVGRPVILNLSSRDVIHSFWVPSLHGKTDLIPGHENHVALRADAPGVYRGQCAEFCGFQHAHMGIVVVAEAPADFTRWLDAQRAASREPSDDTGRRGRRVLETSSCALCHTVRGADANGTVGPDLTHLASRATLAAGTLPNGRDALRRWIVDPQSVKPGANMPPTALAPGDLEALLAYLETLG